MNDQRSSSMPVWHGTTIMSVRKNGKVIVAGDGQVSMGQTVMKPNARKVRRLHDGSVIGGFAGATADAFTLFERLEAKLERHNGQLMRAAVELAKDWRMDRFLRRLEAMLIAVNKDELLLLSGNGDVIEPDHQVCAIGSGAMYAQSAALALKKHAPHLTAEEIVRESLNIAADICIYTNHNLVIEKLG